MNEKINEVDRLFDENDHGNIILINERDERVEFSQVAVIPIGDQIYALLGVVEGFDDIEEDEYLCFLIAEDDEGNSYLEFVDDEEILNELDRLYQELLEE